MKKIISVLILIALASSFSACTGNKSGDKKEPVKSTSIPTVSNNTTSSIASEVISTNTPSTAINNQTENISRDKAIELALEHAGLTRNDVFDLEAEKDRERGGIYWEVDFEDGQYEYSYDINAETGEVKKVERDRD